MPVKQKEKKDDTRSYVWLWLESDDHQRLREAAAKRGVPMSEFSRSVVLEAIDKVIGRKQ